MDKASEGKPETKPQVCGCGRTSRPAGTVTEEPLICPHCGTPVQESTGDTSLADTHMIDVREMARIAQQGLDVAVSGNRRAPKQGGAKKTSKHDTKS
jgi:hypothetical protein